MIWFFEQQGQRLQYEIRREAHGDGYELTVSYPGKEPMLAERFDDPYALHERALRVERSLAKNGWHTPTVPLTDLLSAAGKTTWSQCWRRLRPPFSDRDEGRKSKVKGYIESIGDISVTGNSAERYRTFHS